MNISFRVRYEASVHYGIIVLCPLLEISYDTISVSFCLFPITINQNFDVLAAQRRIVYSQIR